MFNNYYAVHEEKLSVLGTEKAAAALAGTFGITGADYGKLDAVLSESGLVDTEKLAHYIDGCSGALLITSENPEQWAQFSRDGATFLTTFERDVSAALDTLGIGYTYRSVHGGETGCFVVDPRHLV